MMSAPEKQPTIGRRICIVGPSGSGKTTLARQLSRALDRPHIEMDALHWTRRDWKMPFEDRFKQRVYDAIQPDEWVLDGNYSLVRTMIWKRADTMVWLDVPLWRCQLRLLRRSWLRWWRQELLWGTNREQFWNLFQFNPDSLLYYNYKKYKPRKRTYAYLLQQPEYAHLRVHRLDGPTAVSRWLAAAPGRVEEDDDMETA